MAAIKVVPLGAGQDVGRSCVLVTLGGKTIMFDCGIHMGYTDERRCAPLWCPTAMAALLPYGVQLHWQSCAFMVSDCTGSAASCSATSVGRRRGLQIPGLPLHLAQRPIHAGAVPMPKTLRLPLSWQSTRARAG
jgi:hypothetical protein